MITKDKLIGIAHVVVVLIILVPIVAASAWLTMAAERHRLVRACVTANDHLPQRIAQQTCEEMLDALTKKRQEWKR